MCFFYVFVYCVCVLLCFISFCLERGPSPRISDQPPRSLPPPAPLRRNHGTGSPPPPPSAVPTQPKRWHANPGTPALPMPSLLPPALVTPSLPGGSFGPVVFCLHWFFEGFEHIPEYSGDLAVRTGNRVARVSKTKRNLKRIQKNEEKPKKT